MRKFVFIFLFLFAGALGLAFFSFEKPTRGLPPDPQGRGALVMTVISDCGSLDPGFTNTLRDFRIIRSLYEPLLRIPRGGGDPEPAVAAALPEISSDGKTYRLTLRPEATWSNGEPVTTQDFRYAWMRAMLPDTGCKYISLMELVAGAKAFGAWREKACLLADGLNHGDLDSQLARKTPQEAQMLRDFLAANPWLNDAAARTPEKLWARTLTVFDQWVGLTASGNTLCITLEKPTPYFASLLTFPTFSPLHQASLEKRRTFVAGSTRIDRDTHYFLPGTLISNGPYRLDEWVTRRSMTLNQNPHYWERNAMGNIRLIQRVVPENTTSLNLLKDGLVDIVLDVGQPTLQAQLVEHADIRRDVNITPTAGTYYYQFNCRPQVNGRKNPLANPKVRRALAACIDRKAITEQVTRLHQPLAKTFTPVGSIPGYVPPQEAGVDFDPALAKKLLAESGEKFDAISLLYNTTGAHKAVAVAIAKQWEEHLGITIHQDACEYQPMLDRRRAGNFEVCRAGWYGDYPDPTTFLDMFVTGNSNNNGGYSNPQFDALMTQASDERDPQKRLTLLRQAETLLLQDMPLATIYGEVEVKLFDKTQNDLMPDAWGNYRLECVPSKRR